jgi:hypothetical protein
MADWKDFYEDNRVYFGQYLDSLSERAALRDGPKARADAFRLRAPATDVGNPAWC